MKRSYSFVKPGLRGRTLWSSWFKTANAPQRISPLTAFPPLFQNHCRVLYRLHICWFSTGKERWGVTRTSRWQQCCSNVINVDTSLRNVIYMKSLLPHVPLFENKHALNACWADVLKQWLFFDSADVQVHGIFVFQVCMQIKWVLKLLRCCWKTSDTMAAWTNSCRTRWVWERATCARTHTLRPYSDLTLTLLCSSLSSWRWQRERLGFEPVLWHYTHRQQFTSQSSWLRSETLTAQDWPKWCLFCSRVTVSVLILLLYLVLVSDAAPQVILGSESSWSVINLVCCCICRQSSQ